jgi:hypothetical protein
MTQLLNNVCETGEWLKDLGEVTMIALKKKPKLQNALTIAESASLYSKIGDIWYRIIWKSPLTGKLTKSPIIFHSCINLQHRPLFRESDWLMHCSCYAEWWSDAVVWYNQLLYCLCLLQGVTVQCLEYLIFVMEGARKKVGKGSVNDKGTNRHVIGLNILKRYVFSILISGK